MSKTSKAELTDYLNKEEMQMTELDMFRFFLSKKMEKNAKWRESGGYCHKYQLICNLQPWNKVLGTRMLCNKLSVCLGLQVNKRAAIL